MKPDKCPVCNGRGWYSKAWPRSDGKPTEYTHETCYECRPTHPPRAASPASKPPAPASEDEEREAAICAYGAMPHDPPLWMIYRREVFVAGWLARSRAGGAK